MVSCYTLRKKIDEGGFGSVFQAIQNETRTNDTLEFLADPSPDARLRFEREARLLIRLRGPSIVQILDMNLRATNPYIVLEYSSLGSADKWISHRESPLSVVGLLATITHAICRFHDAGGFHRDIKPPNILLFRDAAGNLAPKLSDLGLARTREIISPHMTCGPYGTRGYMAPELFQGGAFNTKCDIYSLGITKH